MQLRSLLPEIVRCVCLAVLAVAALTHAHGSVASERDTLDAPAWLLAHVGTDEGQIAAVVLQRARALHLKKTKDGVVKNPCYLAMDATRPSSRGHGRLNGRFYVICEADRSFRAVPSGYGIGRNLKGIVNFANGRRCAKNFGNALDSRLTAGGPYVTREEITSFKGYYRASAKRDLPFLRTFVQFEGEDEASNARTRAIGGHPAVLLQAACRKKDPRSPYANHDGFVPFGKLIDYTGGRSSGCTSWAPSDSRTIMALLKNNPTTLYIYPEAHDIEAVAQAVKAHGSPSHADLYWNVSCLKQIGAPKFWPKETLGPIIAKYEAEHPISPPPPLPVCKGG